MTINVNDFVEDLSSHVPRRKGRVIEAIHRQDTRGPAAFLVHFTDGQDREVEAFALRRLEQVAQPRRHRHAHWGHWSLSFWERPGCTCISPTEAAYDLACAVHGLTPYDWSQPGRLVAEVPFPVGIQGPMDGLLGSPERRSYQDMVTAWVERGELPTCACFATPDEARTAPLAYDVDNEKEKPAG